MTVRERLGFSAAGFGQNLVLNFVNLFLLVFLVEGVGLRPSGVAKVTAVLTAAKVWDACCDVVIGLLIDRTRTRWGRFRPYVLATAVPVCLLLVLLFTSPAQSENARVAWFGVCYVLFAMAYTLGDVPYWSLTTVIAPDDASRTRLIAWARTAGAIALAVVTLAGAPLARLLGEDPHVTTTAGWMRAALLVAVLGMGLFTLAFFATRERVPLGAPTHAMSPRAALAQLRGSGALLRLLASGALGFGRYVLQVGGAVVALIVFGDEQTFTLLGAALIAAMIAATLLTPLLLARMTRRDLMIRSSLVAAIVYAAMWPLGHASLPAVLVMVALSGLLLGVFMVTQTAMFGDAADEAELRTGARIDGLTFAGLTFLTKLGNALATVVFGAVLAWVGYQKGDPVTEPMRAGVWATITLVPALSCLLGVLPLRRYAVPERELPELLSRARRERSAAGTS